MFDPAFTILLSLFLVAYALSKYDQYQFNKRSHLEDLTREAASGLQDAMNTLIGDEDSDGSEFKGFEALVTAMGTYLHVLVLIPGGVADDGFETDRFMTLQQNVKFSLKEHKQSGTGLAGLAAAILTKAKRDIIKHTPSSAE